VISETKLWKINKPLLRNHILLKDRFLNNRNLDLEYLIKNWNNIEIEHIFPRKLEEYSLNFKELKDYGFKQNNCSCSYDYNKCRLGNYLFLEKEYNDKASNQMPDFKNNSYKDSNLINEKELFRFENFSKDEIDKREKELIQPYLEMYENI